LVDTSTEAGQALLRDLSPIRKVPLAELPGGALVYDSHAITELLLANHGPGPLRAFDPLELDVRNTLGVIDAALESLINAFYLARDGIGAEQSSYVVKQRERAAASFAWLEQRLDDVWLSPPAPSTAARSLSLVEIALVTTIGWVRFRDTYPIDRSFPGLARCFAHHDVRPSFAATRPHA
jgi:glutathione S-transferase